MEEAKEDEARRGGAGGRGGAAGDRRHRMGPRVTGCTETVEASVFANEPVILYVNSASRINAEY